MAMRIILNEMSKIRTEFKDIPKYRITLEEPPILSIPNSNIKDFKK